LRHGGEVDGLVGEKYCVVRAVAVSDRVANVCDKEDVRELPGERPRDLRCERCDVVVAVGIERARVLARGK
jgi:hypothetical protein